MFARTSTWSGSQEALQKWAGHAAGTVKGFRASTVAATGTELVAHGSYEVVARN